MTTTFTITNITCEACVALSTQVLSELPGVKQVSIDIQSGKTIVEANHALNVDEVKNCLDEVGKTVSFS